MSAELTERPPLSRTRVAEAALILGDQEGLDGLSMRKIGAALRVEAMSLYNHVANKEDLLDAIGDLLYQEILDRYTTDAQSPWIERAFDLVLTFTSVALAHPKLSPILLDRPATSLTKLRFLHCCFEIYVSAGFPVKQAALAFNTTAAWLTGTVRSEVTIMAQLADRRVPFSKEDLPSEFHSVVDFMEACNASTTQERLESGFNTLIAGLRSELDIDE